MTLSRMLLDQDGRAAHPYSRSKGREGCISAPKSHPQRPICRHQLRTELPPKISTAGFDSSCLSCLLELLYAAPHDVSRVPHCRHPSILPAWPPQSVALNRSTNWLPSHQHLHHFNCYILMHNYLCHQEQHYFQFR